MESYLGPVEESEATNAESSVSCSSPPNGSRGESKRSLQFMDLPLEIREMIWRFALPGPRVITVLVYAFPGLKLAPLEREALRMTLSQVCFESRRVVKEAGYILAFRDESSPHDQGIWFHPRKDILERTLWGPGEDWGPE